jgi:gluconolactonase
MMRVGAGGEIGVYREPSAYANGSTLDRELRLVTCEHLNRRVVREESDGRLTVLADQFEGRPLNSPNDVIVGRDGAIWFTDPTYGIDSPNQGRPAPSEQRGRFVFRLNPEGRLDVASDSFEQPNGLVFSPDERILYISESGSGREIRAFDVEDGRLRRERSFAKLGDDTPDGLAVDEDGRVYAAAGSGVRIWKSDGAFLGMIRTPGFCANLTFGGPDGRRLYICDETHVHAVEMKIRGCGFPG